MAKRGTPTAAPRLRFPEFRKNAWNRIPGEMLFDLINNRHAEAGLPILAITQEYGAIPRDLIDYHVSVTEKSIESYKVVERGDFIISLRSFQGGIEYSNYHGVCSPAYVILRRKEEGSDQYFRHLFKSDRFIQQLTRNVEGLRDGKMISYKQFSEQLIPTPQPSEQQKIADCLTSLDEVIAAQGRKVGALKTHKRGLMQQLFPREGETRPRLRFPEFRDAPEWSDERLGNLVDIRSGNSPSHYQLSKTGAYPFVKVEDLNNCVKYQSEAREYSDDTDGVIPTSSLIFPKRGAAIELNKIRLNEREILMDTNMMALTPNSDLRIEFLFYCISHIGLSQIADSSTIPQINNKHIIPFKVVVPSSDEQQRIADCLSSLDTQITAESNQLTTLKTHKQGLMQQLFPLSEKVS